MNVISLWQIDIWHGDIFHTEGPVTFLTVEMGVEVAVMVILLVAVADFVLYIVAAVLDGVDKMSLLEGCQGSEDVGLVDRVDLRLQFRHGHGAPGLGQTPGYQNPVGSQADTMSAQQFFNRPFFSHML